MFQGKFFKEIPDHPNLYASADGQILTDNYKQKLGNERILKQSDDGHGYLQITYNYKIIKVHQLTCKAWHDNPENLSDVDHIDGNPKNNHKDNLRWATHKDNCNWGTRNQRVSKQVVQLTLEGDFIRIWDSATCVQRELNYCQGHISDCCSGKRKSSKGYKWMYLADYQKLN